MKKVVITNQIGWRILFAILCLVGYCSSIDAQNVTISPTSGKLIAAYTSSNEVGFIDGYSSMWRHNQLPLTMTVADKSGLTANGLLQTHADNLRVYENKLINMSTGNSYMVLSLPKGYRFTSYKFVITNNLTSAVTTNYASQYGNENNWYFCETDKTYGTNYRQVDLGRYVSDTEFTVTRTSTGKGDMSNLLYFVFKGNTAGKGHFGAISYKSIEVTFAPDDAFTVSLAPTATNGTGVDYVNAPFNTSKIDIGAIEKRTKTEGNYTRTFYTYSYNNVTDLYANNVLYEGDCVNSTGTVGSTTGIKGITSVLSNNSYYYGLKANTYYVETPTTATESGNVVVPIGYRITGATINYAYGNAFNGSGYYITYNNQNTTYYLNTSLKFVTSPQTVWQTDANGHIHNGTTYLRWNNNGGTAYLVQGTSSSANVIINNSYITIEGYNNWRLKGNNNNSTPYFSTIYNNDATIANATTVTAAPYTLTVYDKDGNTIKQTVDVNSSNTSGSVVLTGLNNDAVKFAVGTVNGNNPTALITISLTLEPLNPYIHSMDVVCNGPNSQRLSQQFTTDDFSVGGDTFIFYVPSEYENYNCLFTFENLRSKYSDSTYGPLSPETPGNSRYNFVKSSYYNTVGEDLYANAATVANHTYTDKVLVDVAGNQAFTFNNADVLSNTNTGANTNYLQEYPFSLNAYTAAGGDFTNVRLKTGDSRTCYLFVGDETRYNIAPTTATRHLYYAYYLMTIKLVTKTYTPSVTWVPVYNSSLTYDVTTGTDVNNYLAGVKLGTTEAGTTTTYGYLTVDQILTKMQADIDNGVANAPTNLKNVLFVDGGDLYSIVYDAEKTTTTGDVTTTTPDGLEQMKNALSANALVYLPANNTYKADNFAYKTVSGTFKSCNNIVLTDKQSFFAPYEIQVDEANYATYKRLFTTAVNGKVNKATIMLPFTMTLDGHGLHSNRDGNCEFTVYTMQTDNCLEAEATDVGGTGNVGKDFMGTAHFTEVTGTTTEANKPYMVKISKFTGPDATTGSYVATQYGSNIKATPNTNADANVVCTGETATGTIANLGTYTFVNKGTYAGQTLKKNYYIFYFGKNYFYLNQNLTTENLYVYPFRSYYTSSAPAGAAKLSMMDIAFGENSTTAITEARQQADFAVITGQGTLTAVAKNDANLSIHNLAGQSVAHTAIHAGETLTFNVPAGIYIINGKKVSVK
jgi:predicted lipoprotein with Yx(FWY)xxD motif